MIETIVVGVIFWIASGAFYAGRRKAVMPTFSRDWKQSDYELSTFVYSLAGPIAVIIQQFYRMGADDETL